MIRFLRSALLLASLLAGPLAAQTWEAVAPLPAPRTAAAVAVLDGRLYVLGGVGPGGAVLGSALRYDPVAAAWSPIATLREARAGATAVVYGGRIVLMGGRRSDGRAIDDAETYDAQDDDWESFDHLETGRNGLGAAVLGSRIFALGGASENGALLATCEAYDGTSWYAYPAWTIDPARAEFGLAAAGGALVLAGGFSPFGPLASVQRYVPEGGGTALAPLPDARGGLGLAATDDGSALWAVGGRDAGDAVRAEVFRYDVGGDAWTAAPSLPQARTSPSVAVLGSALYVAGGRDGFGDPTATVWRLSGLTASDDAPGREPPGLVVSGPNPVRHQTALTVHLGAPTDATVEVVDVQGRRVARLHDGLLASGATRLVWRPAGLAAGVYQVRLQTPVGVATLALTVLP